MNVGKFLKLKKSKHPKLGNLLELKIRTDVTNKDGQFADCFYIDNGINLQITKATAIILAKQLIKLAKE